MHGRVDGVWKQVARARKGRMGGGVLCRSRPTQAATSRRPHCLPPLTYVRNPLAFVQAPAPKAAAVPAGTAVRVVKYSDKSVAVFGSTLPVKDTLKACGGMYNPRLHNGEGAQAPGWIFPATKHAAVVAALRGVGASVTDAVPAAAGPGASGGVGAAGPAAGA